MEIKQIPPAKLNPLLIDFLEQAQIIKAIPTLQTENIAFAVEDHGKIIGGMSLKLTGESLHLSLLAVDKKQQNKGLGSQLIQAAEDFARKKQLTTITLTTKSYQALPFYLKHDYQIFAELSDVPLKGLTKYYLLKKIS